MNVDAKRESEDKIILKILDYFISNNENFTSQKDTRRTEAHFQVTLN